MKKALAFLVYLLLSVPIFAGGVSGGGGGGSGSASDATLTTSDITTNDVSTTKHGFAPKAPNDATKYLNGLGAWAVPAGGGTDIPSLIAATQAYSSDLTIVRQGTDTSDKRVQLSQIKTLFLPVPIGLGGNSISTNVAIATGALTSNTTAIGCTAVGNTAANANTQGDYATAFGYNALALNQTGANNVAVGASALYNTVSGGGNTAIGGGALIHVTGTGNSGLGYSADVAAGVNDAVQLGSGYNTVSTTCNFRGNRIADTNGLAITAGSGITVTKAATGVTLDVAASTPAGVIAYNHFDNPDFQVSQVGGASPAQVTAASTTDTAHWVDRWRVRNTSGASTVNINRVAKSNYTLPGSKSNFVTKFTGNNSGNTFALYQRFTDDQTKKMGPKLSMSFWVRTVCSVSAPTAKILMKTPSAANNFGTVAIVNEAAVGYSVPAITRNTWTQVTYTIGDTDASAWTNYPYGMQVELELTIPAGDSSWEVACTDFQLNNGTSAATFVNPTLAENEARCFVFYQKTFQRATPVAQNSGVQDGALLCKAPTTGANTLCAIWTFSPKMRATPSILTYSFDNASNNWSPGGGGYIAATNYANENCCNIYASTGTTTVGTGYYIHASADSRL